MKDSTRSVKTKLLKNLKANHSEKLKKLMELLLQKNRNKQILIYLLLYQKIFYLPFDILKSNLIIPVKTEFLIEPTITGYYAPKFTSVSLQSLPPIRYNDLF